MCGERDNPQYLICNFEKLGDVCVHANGRLAEASENRVELNIKAWRAHTKSARTVRRIAPATTIAATKRLRALLPRCLGRWSSGSGGHRRYDRTEVLAFLQPKVPALAEAEG